MGYEAIWLISLVSQPLQKLLKFYLGLSFHHIIIQFNISYLEKRLRHLYSVKKKFFSVCEPCGILVPRSGIKPTPPALEVQSLSYWTVREDSDTCILRCYIFTIAIYNLQYVFNLFQGSLLTYSDFALLDLQISFECTGEFLLVVWGGSFSKSLSSWTCPCCFCTWDSLTWYLILWSKICSCLCWEEGWEDPYFDFVSCQTRCSQDSSFLREREGSIDGWGRHMGVHHRGWAGQKEGHVEDMAFLGTLAGHCFTGGWQMTLFITEQSVVWFVQIAQGWSSCQMWVEPEIPTGLWGLVVQR